MKSRIPALDRAWVGSALMKRLAAREMASTPATSATAIRPLLSEGLGVLLLFKDGLDMLRVYTMIKRMSHGPTITLDIRVRTT